jgi:putative heme-binding domain-containing protein
MKFLSALLGLMLVLAAALPARADDPLAVLVRLLGQKDDPRFQLDLLRGMSDGLKGQRSVPMPAGWEAVEIRLAASSDPAVRSLAQTLSLTFGSERARQELRQTLNDEQAPAAARRTALDALVGIKDAELPPSLQALLRDPGLRGPALRALAGYQDPKTPEAVLGAYATFDPALKRDALNTLVSRVSYAAPLVAAIAAQRIPAKDLTADIVRQLRGLKDPALQTQVTKLYGTYRESSADKKAEIEKYRRLYSSGGSQPGNASPGRVVFNKVCAQCHTLFDVGGKVGPDITGANRTDLNYLLETILDPNAVIPNEYRTTEIETKDGRSLVGIVKVMGDKAVQLQTANELLSIPRDEIASQRQTELSMMPEGLLSGLSDQEVRDLIYYLTRLGQVPLPGEAK